MSITGSLYQQFAITLAVLFILRSECFTYSSVMFNDIKSSEASKGPLGKFLKVLIMYLIRVQKVI